MLPRGNAPPVKSFGASVACLEPVVQQLGRSSATLCGLRRYSRLAKMRQKSGPQEPAAERVLKDIRRATRKHHSTEDKIRIALEGLRGGDSIAALFRRR